MNWRNVLLDELPKDRQKVLISYHGIYYSTIFYEQEKLFVLQDDPSASFPIGNTPIYWIEMGDN